MGAIANMSAFKVFDVFDPIGEAFADMEMTDVYFSKIQEPPGVDERIVLVNIAQRSRFEIGMMLDSISQHNPAVIGMDTFFHFPHDDDSLGDAVLADALNRVPNLVMASKLEYNIETDSFDSLTLSWPTFMTNANTAFVNLETGAATQGDLKMCRSFAVSEEVYGEEEWAFGVKLASYLAPENAQKFVDRGNDTEVVNYRGNIIDFGATDFGNMFYALDDIDV
jgi:CHASE2 domain-containing sensor protein